MPLLTELPREEDAVILEPDDTTLNSSAPGSPDRIPVIVVPPLSTSIVVPEPFAPPAIAPLLSAGKACVSLLITTV